MSLILIDWNDFDELAISGENNLYRKNNNMYFKTSN